MFALHTRASGNLLYSLSLKTVLSDTLWPAAVFLSYESNDCMSNAGISPRNIRTVHYTPRTQGHIGVVDKLKNESSIRLPASGVSRTLLEILEFRPDGTVLETWKTPDILQLHPRDASLFTHDAGFGQRAFITPRLTSILFRTETCKAIIYKDKAILFPALRVRDTIRIAQHLKNAISSPSPLPFEMRCLESLLSETARSFEAKCKRLGMVAQTVLDDINASFHNSAGELQRLIPITRKLTEMQHDVKETLEAVKTILDDDQTLKEICLTENWKKPKQINADAADATATTAAAVARKEQPHPLRSLDPHTAEMRMGSSVLESYEFSMESTSGQLEELLENIEQTKTVWHMQLDHQRNRVLRVNLLLSMIAIGGVSAQLPAAFFGMNLESGWEGVPGLFPVVVQYSLFFGIATAASFYMYYKYGPKRRHSARLRDMRSLRDLLMFHLDDLDAILEAVKEKTQEGRLLLDRKEFAEVVQSAVRGRPMSSDEVKLLHRVFDKNSDGFVEVTELVRLEEHLDDLELRK